MSERVIEQSDREPLSLGYFRSPYALMRLGLPGKQLKIASVIYSYSNLKRRPGAQCAMSFYKLAGSAGASVSTAKRAIRRIETLQGIDFTKESRDDDGRRLPCLRYSLHIKSGGAVTHFRFLMSLKFDMKDGNAARTLRDLEETIVSIFLTNATNPKAKKGFECSYESLAHMTGRSARGVEEAIRRLLRAGIIHRPKKGTSKYRKSRYTVCKKLRLMAGKEKLEDVKPNAEGQAKDRRTRAEIDADARTLWERHFAPLHARAQAIADANVRRAESDRDYAAVHKEIRGLEPAIARAKHDGDRRTAERLTRRHASLKVLQARILSRLGLTAADLQPKYKCTVCEDTGFRKSDGRMCDCWQLPKSGHEGEKAN